MHPVANHLIQLQELVLIRDEQKIAGAPERLEALNDSIKTMTAKLPADTRVFCGHEYTLANLASFYRAARSAASNHPTLA